MLAAITWLASVHISKHMKISICGTKLFLSILLLLYAAEELHLVGDIKTGLVPSTIKKLTVLEIDALARGARLYCNH